MDPGPSRLDEVFGHPLDPPVQSACVDRKPVLSLLRPGLIVRLLGRMARDPSPASV